MDGDPTYFSSPAEWRAWLERHHGTKTEVWVGMYKAHTDRAGLSWALAVREALCFGWIDGQLKRVDADRHMQRFTPRKRTSKWSAVNVKLVAELEAEGLMRDAGRRAFAARDTRVKPYSTSNRPAQLDGPYDARLRENADAATFWDETPASYRKTVAFWISDAKRDETKEKRFAELLAACESQERLARFTR